MNRVSERLKPMREEFGLRSYDWSLESLNALVCDDRSLFWKIPGRVVSNLRLLLTTDTNERQRLFLVHLAQRQHALTQHREPVLQGDELSFLVRRSVDPSHSDVLAAGLLPLDYPVASLNQKKFRGLIRAGLNGFLGNRTDPNERGALVFDTSVGPWRIITRIVAPARNYQVELEWDVILGMGDLYLERQISLHGMFGIGPSWWDLIIPGHEADAAELIVEYCRFMISTFSRLLDGMVSSISAQEVAQAEGEWVEWLNEKRVQRGKAPFRNTS